MRKDFKSTVAAVMANYDVWAGHCPARAEHSESVFPTSFLQFHDVAASICLHKMHRLSCDLAQDNQS